MNGGDLDLAEVMEQIRREAQKRNFQSFNNGDRHFKYMSLQDSDPARLASLPNALPPELKLQPELENREQYQLGYLLGFHDEAFVRNAYEVIVKREPDDAGFAQYLNNLRSGRYSKIDILRSLRFSAEGRNANAAIQGLSRASMFRKIYRVPVVGYVAQLVVAIFRLPILIANFRRLENHTAAQLDRVAAHVNELATNWSDINREQLEWAQAQFAASQQQLEILQTVLRLHIESPVPDHQNLVHDLKALKTDLALSIAHNDKQLREQSKIHELQTAELETVKAQVEKHMQTLTGRLQNLRMDIAQQENRLAKLLEDGNGKFPASLSGVQPRAKDLEQDHLLDSLYCSLEDGLRGAPSEIKEGVKVYLPVLHAAGIKGGVLDVGCGRGEWLQVLREAGIEATGIDNNRILIRNCKELNLDVIEADALAYLRSVNDQTFSVITAIHFAEHLSLPDLIRFLDEAARTLKPQGLLILETPNPENLLVGSCNFYLDPTHKNPIPIPTLTLLVEARGFQCQQVMKLHPVSNVQIEVKDQLTSHLNHYLYGPMNYAVIARRPPQA